LVTGGASGIGAAICAALLAAGTEVVCIDRTPPEPADGQHFIQADLTDPAATLAAAAQAATRWSLLRLVHAAGAIHPALIAEASGADLAILTQLHLAAPLTLLQAALPAMRAARFGRVVLIGSRAGLGLATRSAYAATKAGMLGLARTWALELAGLGITVNVVAPGPIAGTAMFHNVVPAGSAREAVLAASIPVGRLGAPDDVARAVAFFLDDKAGFVTGQTLYVCGGASVGSLSV
jgi:NAD(P)-dependent dehydrogenase (short-subunit alcohol dehydrogenase family)